MLPPQLVSAHARWLRLLVSLTLAGVAKDRAQAKHQVLLLVDEFAALGYLRPIEAAFGVMAGLGCKLWVVAQDLAQIKAFYPRSWETFFANAGCVQVFAANDLETCNYVSGLLGRRKMAPWEERDRSGNSGDVPLLTADEIRRFTRRERGLQVVFTHGAAPMRLKRVNYDRRFKAGSDYSRHPQFEG